MRYYCERTESGAVGLLYTSKSCVSSANEITLEEYKSILDEIREKAALVDKLYSGVITLADVPTAWQEEIQRRVDERIAAEGEAAEQDISAEEALDIILGGGGV